MGAAWILLLVLLATVGYVIVMARASRPAASRPESPPATEPTDLDRRGEDAERPSFLERAVTEVLTTELQRRLDGARRQRELEEARPPAVTAAPPPAIPRYTPPAPVVPAAPVPPALPVAAALVLPPPQPAARLAVDLLRDRRAMVTAFVLREILDPPVSRRRRR